MSRRARSRVVLAAVLFGGGLTSSAVATTPIAPRDVLVGPAPVAGFNAHAVRAAAARNWLALAGARSATQVVYRERSHAFLFRIVATPTGARATALALRLRRLAGGRREHAIDRAALGLKRRATPPHPVVVKLAGGAVAELVIATEPRAAIRAQLTKVLRARAAALAAETPWTALLRRVARAGRVTPRTAEQAFAMALGPLPGVKVPAAGSTLVDGTIAVRWLNSVWSRVPARVRAAALKALRGPAPATTRDVDNFQPNLLYQQMAETAAVDIGSHLGQTLTLPMVAGFRSAKGIALGVTFGIDLQGNEVTVDDQGHVSAPLFACRIGITPKGQATFGPRLQETIYHEVFHCFQIQMAGVKKWFQDGHPWDWLYEGSAEWVGCDLVPAAGDAVGWYKEYLEDPGTTVLDRTYADMGYYAHLDEEGVPTWANWPSVFTQTKMQDALDGTIKGFDSQVFTTWAPGFLRAPGRGALWDAKAPCIPPDKAAPLLLPVYKGNPPNHVTVEQFANQLWQLTSNTGALGFAVEQGYGRLSSADGSTDEAVREDAICVKQGGCKCPDGLGNEIVLPQVTDPVLAVGAGRKQGEVAAVAIDIDKLCKEKAPPNPGGGGGGGGGYSNGDPHMRTFDGQLYDFQAAGEFVLARSSDGTFEVQGRQETSGPIKTMTVNTAVAMRIGKHRVGIYLAVPPLVRLDGHKVNPTQKPIDLGGGARLRGGADGITVDRPDGTRVTVRNAGQWGLIAVVDPGAELRGRLQGLLGNFDGDSFNDLRVRGTGARVFANLFGQLYGRYRRSWLVTKRTSLFDYDHGRTTHSYDKPNIPTRPINVDGLTPAQRKKAQATCRAAGVHAEPFLSECVLDVGLTDKDDFATGTAGLQQTLTANAHRTTTTPWQKLTTIPLDSFSSLPIVTALGPNRAMVGWAQRTNPGVNPGLYALSTVDFDSSAATAVANPHPASVVSDWMEVDYGPAFWHPTPTTTAVIFAGGRNVDFNDPYFFKNVVSTHQDDGSWSTPVVVMPSDYPTPAAVGIDGGQPIFIRTVAGSGSLPLFHGINPAQTPFEAYDGGHYALWPVLTRDAAGTVWLAYRTPVSDAATGLYVRPFDAQTALPLGPSQMAPGSAQGADGAGPAPISCPPAGGPCRLVYESADRKSVLSWAPGDAAPVTVAQTNGAREVRGAYDASGRLWVLWKDDTLDGAYTVVRGDARGVGEPLTLDSPPTASGTLPDVGYTSILPLNGGLLVAANLGIDDVRSIYAAFVSG